MTANASVPLFLERNENLIENLIQKSERKQEKASQLKNKILTFHKDRLKITNMMKSSQSNLARFEQVGKSLQVLPTLVKDY